MGASIGNIPGYFQVILGECRALSIATCKIQRNPLPAIFSRIFDQPHV